MLKIEIEKNYSSEPKVRLDWNFLVRNNKNGENIKMKKEGEREMERMGRGRERDKLLPNVIAKPSASFIFIFYNAFTLKLANLDYEMF